jgi:hypothetical protein
VTSSAAFDTLRRGMPISTLTDPTSIEETYTDDVLQLRRWATTKNPIVLPERQDPSRLVEYVIGTDLECEIRVADPDRLVSKQHARLVHDRDGWKIRDVHDGHGLVRPRIAPAIDRPAGLRIELVHDLARRQMPAVAAMHAARDVDARHREQPARRFAGRERVDISGPAERDLAAVERAT